MGTSLTSQLSLGDARAYYLSTAKNELGVVSASSDAGTSTVPALHSLALPFSCIFMSDARD